MTFHINQVLCSTLRVLFGIQLSLLIVGCASSKPENLLTTTRVSGPQVNGAVRVKSSPIPPTIISKGKVAFEPPAAYLESASLSEAIQKSVMQSGLFVPSSDSRPDSEPFTLDVTFTRLFVDLGGEGYSVDLTSTWRLCSNQTHVVMEENVGGRGVIRWPPMNAGHQKAFEVALRDLTANGIRQMAGRFQNPMGASEAQSSSQMSAQLLIRRQFANGWPQVRLGMTTEEVFRLIPQFGVFTKISGSVSDHGDREYEGKGYLLRFKNNKLIEKRENYRGKP